MIISFKNKETEDIFNGIKNKKTRLACPDYILKTAVRKLDLIDSAININDLSVPPGNRLEMLKGNRQGQYSIRINEQYRICFKWTEKGAEDVEITDYH